MYLKNIWYFGHLPFNLNRPYDRYGNEYNISRVMDGAGNFLQEEYEHYSVSGLQDTETDFQPLYSTAGYTSIFIFFFATYAATVVHVLLYHHRDIWNTSKHFFLPAMCRKQRSVKPAQTDVPLWWYAVVYFVSFGMAFAALVRYVPDAPKWVLQTSLRFVNV